MGTSPESFPTHKCTILISCSLPTCSWFSINTSVQSDGGKAKGHHPFGNFLKVACIMVGLPQSSFPPIVQGGLGSWPTAMTLLWCQTCTQTWPPNCPTSSHTPSLMAIPSGPTCHCDPWFHHSLPIPPPFPSSVGVVHVLDQFTHGVAHRLLCPMLEGTIHTSTTLKLPLPIQILACPVPTPWDLAHTFSRACLAWPGIPCPRCDSASLGRYIHWHTHLSWWAPHTDFKYLFNHSCSIPKRLMQLLWPTQIGSCPLLQLGPVSASGKAPDINYRIKLGQFNLFNVFLLKCQVFLQNFLSFAEKFV